MKRFILGWGMAVLLALGYVQQRVGLITLGYQVESLNSERDDLLDQHRVLNYNVLALRSPVILDERLSKQDVQLIPPQAIEILSLPSRVHTSSGLAWGRAIRPEGSWWQQALKQGTRWLGLTRLAVAEPVGGDK